MPLGKSLFDDPAAFTDNGKKATLHRDLEVDGHIEGDVNLNSGDLILGVAGEGINIATGTNARMGLATLVGGTVTVPNTEISSTLSYVMTSRITVGGTAGHLSAPTASIVNGTSFVINSSSGSDTSTVLWIIFDKLT